ncbi:MAG: hypothetical protein JO197_04950 [Acidobacteria bacterium]|nr:hypothetical protein [Acidobacteriota bacterium]MBV9475195.1 hypothetical protein [Acidobacteriota bacterium]
MKRAAIATFLFAAPLFAQSKVAQSNVAQSNVAQSNVTPPAAAPVNLAQVADDAIVLDRVAQASKRDLPADLLKRIVNEDIDALRGKRSDGTYDYATFERFESGRTSDSFTVQPRADKMSTLELKGAFIYRVILEVPTRRLLVRKNNPVWVERVDYELMPQGSAAPERQTIDVKAWLQPGETKPLDLPSIGRQVTVHVIASADPKAGYGNLDLTLVHAKIVDRPDSPYIDAVESAKAVLRALDNNDVKSIRAMAQRMRDTLGAQTRNAAPVIATSSPATPAPAQSNVTVTASRDAATELEMQTELQMIEDLLTGSESERREGLDRLHQLIRRMRR